MKDRLKLSLLPPLAMPAARRKNVLGTMMHSFILMAVVTVIWAVAGYSLAFGGSSPFIGDLHFAFLNHVGSAPSLDYPSTIPQAAGPCRIST
jgi:Amt family ammonium transporter